MSPRSLRVPTRNFNLKYVSTGAICAIINNPGIDGSQVDLHQKEEIAVKERDGDIAGKNAMVLRLREVWPAAQDRVYPPSKDSLAAAFVLHMSVILELMPSCPLKNQLSTFMGVDWPDIEQLLDGRKSIFTRAIKRRWKAVELSVEDTDDILLQEGALLLSLVMGEPDMEWEFNTNVGALRGYIGDGLRDRGVPPKVKFLLRVFEDGLLRRRDDVLAILRSDMQGDDRTRALETQRQIFFAQFQSFINHCPPSRFRDWFKRRGYRCLINIVECQLQLQPFSSPEIAAFSRSLRAVAGNVSNAKFAATVFNSIHTTLKEADKSPTPEVASLFAAQCNELISQHERCLSPEVLALLKAQGEAVLKRISNKSD